MAHEQLREIADDERREEISRLFAETEADILVLPESRLPDDVGVYNEALIDLVKDLRNNGCMVSWADAQEQRQYMGKKSAVAAIILSLGISVAGTAAWDVIKMLFRTAPRNSNRVRCEIFRQTNADGSELEKLTYDGTGDGLAELIERTIGSALPTRPGDDATAPPALPTGPGDDGTERPDDGSAPLVPPS